MKPGGERVERLYKHYTNEGGIRDPCIVYRPVGMQRRGVIENTPVHLIDIMPTIVEAAGVRYPDRIGASEIYPMAGHSLLPALGGQRMGFAVDGGNSPMKNLLGTGVVAAVACAILSFAAPQQTTAAKTFRESAFTAEQ